MPKKNLPAIAPALAYFACRLFFMALFHPPKPFFLRIGNQLFDLQEPRIMGILNVSDDSFYSGSRALNENELLKKAGKMLSEGACFLDIGAASSRPGAVLQSAVDEWALLGPALKAVKKHFPEAMISADTFRSEIARQAIEEGADIINDISGGLFDENIFQTVAKARKVLILMHIKGTFETMHQPYSYSDIAVEVVSDLKKQIEKARKAGFSDIVADPGFGFSKKGAQNFELLASLANLQHLECPVLAGISRKSMVHKTLNVNPESALNGTTALHMIALQNGARILRVHDVKEAAECITLFKQICLPE